MLEILKETTVWSDGSNANHTYLLEGSKIIAYAKFGGNDIQELRNNAQSMLYGELTIQYLKTLTEVFLNHIHSHPSKPPTYGAKSKYRIEDLKKELQNIEQLLAKNIKIN
jgi:hypothetical protein